MVFDPLQNTVAHSHDDDTLLGGFVDTGMQGHVFPLQL